MADAKTINTRIVLRNDEQAAWERSTKDLLKGEVAFARLSGELSDSFEMRIGTGDKTWSELSASNVVVPDSTKFYEKATLAELEAVAGKNGDIGVVKELIADGKYSYTAYRFDKAANGWVALDGNYSADNVIFDSNITAMYTFGKYVGKEATPVTIPSAGRSISQVFEAALTKVIEPTSVKTQPSISLTGGSALTGEVGTTALTAFPTVTLTYDDGAYTYGPEPTGAKLSSYAISCNIPSTNGTWTTVSETFALSAAKGTSTIKTVNGTALTQNYTYSETPQSFTFTAYNCKYTTGSRQLNNVGSESTYTGVINAGTASNKTTTVSMTGYYPYYTAMFTSNKYVNPANITSADIVSYTDDAVTAKTGWTKTVDSTQRPASITSFTTKKFNQWYWVGKADKLTKVEVTQQSPEAPVTVSKTQVTLPTANGYGDTVYNVFYCNLGNTTLDNNFKVTIS